MVAGQSAWKFHSRPDRVPVRLANSLGPVLRRYGWPLGDLDREAILAAARKTTGLSDWGDDWFLEPLRVLLDSYERDGDLSFLGRVAIRRRTTDLVANRLLVRDSLRRYPAIRQERIERPIIIVGLPRTGTTLLYNLLAQDPALRPLRFWQALRPAPPPGIEPETRPKRIKTARRTTRFIHYVAPQMQVVHAIGAVDPEEICPLQACSFLGRFFTLQCRLTSYIDWLRELDSQAWVRAHADLRQHLQLLQYQEPRPRWVLKSVFHLFHLEALHEVFPDACFVWTHRDPADQIPSSCSLLAASRSFFMQNIDPRELGREVLDQAREAVCRAASARESLSAGQICDVSYRALVREPAATIRRIYEHFGERFPQTLEARIAAWLERNPRHKHGRHDYTLAEFGLDESTVREKLPWEHESALCSVAR